MIGESVRRRDVHRDATPTSSPATSAGAGSTTPEGELYAWDRRRRTCGCRRTSRACRASPEPVADVEGARCLVLLGDSVTTDHISPAGAIRPDSPAGQYLVEHGVERREFNSYGSRRGNHEVMMRGTFANVRLQNQLVPGSEGTWTVHLPDGEEGTIFDVAERYRDEGVPTIVIAGKEYGSGLVARLGGEGAEPARRARGDRGVVRADPPLEPADDGDPAAPVRAPARARESLGLTGREEFSIVGVENGEADEVTVRADGKEFRARVRLDTPREREYLRHGGILQYVLRRLLSEG